MKDILEHYDLVENAKIFDWLHEALKAADDNPDRVWFVRHGDDDECENDCEDRECEQTWDVELYHGQYVNRVGYFVSSEPCRPEDRNEVFTY